MVYHKRRETTMLMNQEIMRAKIPTVTENIPTKICCYFGNDYLCCQVRLSKSAVSLAATAHLSDNCLTSNNLNS